jgi:hypothetical protein
LLLGISVLGMEGEALEVLVTEGFEENSREGWLVGPRVGEELLYSAFMGIAVGFKIGDTDFDRDRIGILGVDFTDGLIRFVGDLLGLFH